MAKNKIEIDVEVKDKKGTTKKMGLESKKAADGMDNLATSAHSARRNLHGAANMSSNTTKNFSKMAQGLGGVVVPAYAAFAAQIFALTAVFGFFKRAGDLSVLQQGQLAYASATGTAMKSLTEDIRAATGAQITFRDAAQSAAIGTAAGLSADQLTRLGKAAKDVSAVLGRDVTDSFNRLVRGVTKAEPELLDELGIILRLKDASEDYARTLGKSASELTTFEKSQAVANNVLGQAEQKYARILAVTGGGAVNQFNTFSAALDDIVMKIQTMLLPIANAFAKVLTDIPALGAASLLLLASGPLRAVGFSLTDMGVRATDMAAKLTLAAEGNTAKMIQLKTAIDANVLSLRAMAAEAVAAGNTSILMGSIAGGSGSLSGLQKGSISQGLKGAANQGLKGSQVFKTGMFAGMTANFVNEFGKAFGFIKEDLSELSDHSKKELGKIDGFFKKTGGKASKFFGRFAEGGAKFLRIAGIIGIVVTVLMLAKQGFDALFPKVLTDADRAAAKLEDQRKKIAELNEELREFLLIQKELDKGTGDTGAGQARAVAALGDFMKNIGSGGLQDTLITDLMQGRENRAKRERKRGGGTTEGKTTDAQKQAITFMDNARERAEEIQRTFGDSATAQNFLDITAEGSKATAEEIKQATVNFMEFATELKELPKLAAENDKLIATFRNSIAPMSATENALQGIDNELASINKQIDDRPRIMVGPLGRSRRRGRIRGDTEGPVGFKRDIKDDEKERIDDLNDTRSIMERSLKNEGRHKLEILKIDGQIADADRNRDKIVGDIEKKRLAVLKTEELINKNTQDKKVLEDTINDANKAVIEENAKRGEDEEKLVKKVTQAQSEKREELEEQGKQLQATLTFQKEEKKLADDLKQARIDIRKATLDQKMINFAKEALVVDQKRLKATQDRLKLLEKESKRRVDREMRDFERGGMFNFLGEDKKRAELELQEALNLETARRKAIEDERDIKIKLIDLEYDLLAAKNAQTQAEIKQFQIEQAKFLDPEDPRVKGLADLLTTLEGNQTTLQATGEGSLRETLKTLLTDQADSKLQDITDNIQRLRDAKADLEDINVLTDGIGESIATNLTSALTDLANGTLNAKQAFKRMALAILADISAMIARMMVFRLLFPGGGGGGGTNYINYMKPSSFEDFFPDMAIPKLRQGGIMKGYSTGGVARGPDAGYPAILHGSEAVVPLPNGKAIPVDLKGGTTQNNITVNVASDGRSTTQGSSGMDSEKLGKAIAVAVQSELHNQKRSGGILNPYGVA